MPRKKAAWPADKVERMPTEDLVPYARNARTHTDKQIDQIAASIKEWGWTNPVLCDEAGGIIAGHGRVLAALKLKLPDVPVMTAVGWSEAKKRAYILADNQLALNAGWNEELLGIELSDLADAGFNLDLIGFEADFIGDMIADLTEGHTDPDDVPEVPEKPVTKKGDVWLLGKHRLVCGDSTSKDDVGLCLNGIKPHLMVTDPPYGVRYDPSWRKKAGLADAVASGDVLNDDRADWRDAWALFPGDIAYVWHGALHAAEVMDSLDACNFKLRAQIVWVKTRAPISRGHYHWQHEPALYVEREGEAISSIVFDHELAAYAVKPGATARWKGGRNQTSVWMIEHLKNDTGHSTQKPVECMRRPILNHSSGGHAVYDPFLGSGTTLIACEMEGRVCHGLELNPGYCDVIVRRWEEFTGETAVLEKDATNGKTTNKAKTTRKKAAGQKGRTKAPA